MGEATQVTQALDGLDDVEEQVPKAKVWARLISLNPTRPTIDLTGEEFVIGRLTCCDVQLKDSMNISGKHCRIFKEACMHGPDIAFLEDLSTNGTFIDGEKVGKGNKLLLSNGVQVALVLNKKKPSESISYIYQECSEEKHYEDGGPQKIYDIRETLGAGNFATVKLAINKATGERFAVKVIDKKKCLMQGAKKDAIMREVEILTQLNHPNIINIRDVFDTDKTLYLVLELVECGELFADIQKNGHYDEEKARDVFKQILSGVLYLHQQGIAHRDLKPENILMKTTDPPIIKISDFGLSRSVGDGSFMKTVCGTPQYLAPEIITSGGIDGYGKEVDMWCVGAILYVLLCGSCPFEEGKAISIFDQIKQGLVEFPENPWSVISIGAKHLIKKLLTVNPALRYTAEQAMDHPWTKGEEMEVDPPPAATTTGAASGASTPPFVPSDDSDPEDATTPKPKPALSIQTPTITPDRPTSQSSNDFISSSNSNSNSNSNNSNSNNKITPDNKNKKGISEDDGETAKTPILASTPTMKISSEKRKREDVEEEEEEEDSSATDMDEEISPKLRKSNNGAKKSMSASSLTKMDEDSSGGEHSGEKSKKGKTGSNNNGKLSKSSSMVPLRKSASHTSSFPKKDDDSASEGSMSDSEVTYSNKTKQKPALVTKSGSGTPTKQLPPCRYGKSCYRKNPAHFQEFSHPDD